MDAFYPFIRRPLLPVQPRSRLITPVAKYSRMLPIELDSPAQRHGNFDQREPLSPQVAEEQPSVAPVLLQTSHHETPPAEQHADAEGHLDLYI